MNLCLHRLLKLRFLVKQVLEIGNCLLQCCTISHHLLAVGPSWYWIIEVQIVLPSTLYFTIHTTAAMLCPRTRLMLDFMMFLIFLHTHRVTSHCASALPLLQSHPKSHFLSYLLLVASMSYANQCVVQRLPGILLHITSIGCMWNIFLAREVWKLTWDFSLFENLMPNTCMILWL